MSRGNNRTVSFCYPEKYEDCNNRCRGMCIALYGNCYTGDKCKFYKSIQKTSAEDMAAFHEGVMEQYGGEK